MVSVIEQVSRDIRSESNGSPRIPFPRSSLGERAQDVSSQSANRKNTDGFQQKLRGTYWQGPA